MISTYLFFPFNDLSDLVTTKVSDATAGQVYVSFNKLDLSFFPTLGLALSDVSVETPMLPPLKAKSLSASPSLLGLITFKPGVTVRAEKFLGGDLVLSTRGGDKNAQGKPKQKISLDFEDLKLNELLSMLDLPVRLNGQATGHLNSTIDVDFTDQPSGEIQLTMEKVLLEEADINIQSMPLSLPRVNFNSIDLEAKAEKGNLEITKLVIGKPGQDISAQVSGRVGFSVIKQGANIFTQPSGFDLSVRAQFGEALKQKLSSYLALLQAYQIAQNTYSIRFTGNNFYGVPNMTKGN